MAEATHSTPTLSLRGIVKEFPGIRALDQVDLDIFPGQVHAIVGENGAGKSTLIHIIAGIYRPDSGNIKYLNEFVRSDADPIGLRRAGINTVFQEAELFPDLSIAENLALQTGLPSTPLGFVDWAEVNATCRLAIQTLDKNLDGSQEADRLSVADRHLLQIANAIRQRAKLIILDEPTSALTYKDSRWLFEQVRLLRDQGTAIIYISHRQEEIFELADSITVLRDGQRIWTRPAADTTPAQLVAAMVGRDAPESSPHEAKLDPSENQEGSDDSETSGLRVDELVDNDGHLQQISLRVPGGEIVGVYGLVGSGRTEMLECLFGLRPSTGSVQINGQRVSVDSPRQAVQAGLALVPEDRLRQGIFPSRTVRDNLALTALKQFTRNTVIDKKQVKNSANEFIDKLAIACRNDRQLVGTLSGGNQQKTVLGRWLMKQPSVLLLDEPTRGVDVGAKEEIHRFLHAIAKEGTAILMVSSDLQEVLKHSDRILVFREGRIAGEFSKSEANAQVVAEVAIGLNDASKSRNANEHNAGKTSAGWSVSRWLLGYEAMLAILVIAIIGGLTFTSEGLLVSSILDSSAVWVLVAMAAGVVILSGAIDISIGSLFALCCVACSQILQSDLPIGVRIPLAIMAAIGVGAVGGAANAAITIYGRVHPIVVTLGMMSVYRGIVILWMGGMSIAGITESFGYLALIPGTGLRPMLLVVTLILVAFTVWLSFSRRGRSIYASGGNEKAAQLCGISRNQNWALAFILGGGLVGIAACFQLAQQLEMQSRQATGWELQAIAMAVVGGVAIQGGRGTMIGCAIGAVLLRLVNSLLVRWELSGEQLNLIIGALILLAVATDHSRRCLRRSWLRKTRDPGSSDSESVPRATMGTN